jgi:signal transduction histidine kinase
MGWVEVLRGRARPAVDGGADLLVPRQLFEETMTEMEADVERLNKIAFRFSNVGSEPRRKVQYLQPIVAGTVEYVRKRLPRLGGGPVIRERYSETPPVNVNAPLIEWVVENLLKNAVDACDRPDGQIEVVVERRPESETVEVRVADNGRGIPPGDHRRIFEPGFTTKKRGWGLGLALAKRIVEEYHGGRIWVKESHPGRGTTIAMAFPV